jgi:DNA-directed RNA polymerase specialized sigma24 family protein
MAPDPQSSTAARPGWSLSERSFQGLLALLDKDEHRAGEEYERLRHRLIGLIRWWGAADAEELADTTLDRVARKLEEPAAAPIESIGPYVRTVARMVFYEARRRQIQTRDDVEPEAPPASTESPLAGCLDRCLDGLDAKDRQLVLRYYDDGKAKDVRRRLCLELGVSSAALRIRVHRLRLELEACVAGCAEPA